MGCAFRVSRSRLLAGKVARQLSLGPAAREVIGKKGTPYPFTLRWAPRNSRTLGCVLMIFQGNLLCWAGGKGEHDGSTPVVLDRNLIRNFFQLSEFSIVEFDRKILISD